MFIFHFGIFWIPSPDSEGIQAVQALQIHPLRWQTLWPFKGLTNKVHMLLIFQEQVRWKKSIINEVRLNGSQSGCQLAKV